MVPTPYAQQNIPLEVEIDSTAAKFLLAVVKLEWWTPVDFVSMEMAQAKAEACYPNKC